MLAYASAFCVGCVVHVAGVYVEMVSAFMRAFVLVALRMYLGSILQVFCVVAEVFAAEFGMCWGCACWA